MSKKIRINVFSFSKDSSSSQSVWLLNFTSFISSLVMRLFLNLSLKLLKLKLWTRDFSFKNIFLLKDTCFLVESNFMSQHISLFKGLKVLYFLFRMIGSGLKFVPLRAVNKKGESWQEFSFDQDLKLKFQSSLEFISYFTVCFYWV